jgi:hypothetical protein
MEIGTQARCQSSSNWPSRGYRAGNSIEESSRRDAFLSDFSSSGKVGLKTLYDLSESDIEVPTTTVAVSRAYANLDRDRVSRFLRAYLEGIHRLMTDRAIGIRALKKYGGTHDDELLAATYDLFTSKYIKKVPNLTANAVQSALNLVAESNPKAEESQARGVHGHEFFRRAGENWIYHEDMALIRRQSICQC